MKLIIQDNVVLKVSAKAKIVVNGIELDDEVMGVPTDGENFLIELPEIVDVEPETIPDDLVTNKYCYTAAAGFYENPKYREQKEIYMQEAYDRAVADTLAMMGVL